MIPEYITIDKTPGLARHTKSMGVVNTDSQSRTKYIIQRDKIFKEKQIMENALRDIEILKSDVYKLMLMVQTLNAK
jgi:hypothetical protein